MPSLVLKTPTGDRHIEFYPGQSLREVLDSTNCRVRSGCRGTGACGLCRVSLRVDGVDEPTLAELLYLSPDQIRAGVRLACQVRPKQDMEVTVLNPAPQSNWKSIAPNHRYRTHSSSFPVCPPLDLPKQVEHPYGVAVDLGTTHISISFCDLLTGKWLTGRRGMNPQVEYGADVLTRLTRASESQQMAQTMKRQAIDAMGEAIHDIAVREGIGAEQVVRVVLGGNTAMLSLLSGRNYQLLLQPGNWMRHIDCLPDNASDLSSGWGLHPEATIEILPPLAGFVGSDLLAGVISTRLIQDAPGSLLIDFGTNSEVALWDGEILWVTSAAGGPAFEGCGISCGMPAEPGAIYQVRGLCGNACVDQASVKTARVSATQYATGLNLDFSTIDGEAPVGLCGSGIVDLIACLVGSGKLSSTGCFEAAIPDGGLLLLDGERRLRLTKRDVDVFQRAKGAVTAAIRVLLSMARMDERGLSRIYVGGAFGHFLNKANAVMIGLLPDVSCESVEPCGNTALAGCEYLLTSPHPSELVRKTAAKARIVNLSQADDFEDFFLEGLYLSRWPQCI